jgi:hypothetical protein
MASAAGRCRNARRSVHRRAQEIIDGGVADLQLDPGIEPGQIDEIRLAKITLLLRRMRRQRFGAQLRHRPHRGDAEDGTVLARQQQGQEKREGTQMRGRKGFHYRPVQTVGSCQPSCHDFKGSRMRYADAI